MDMKYCPKCKTNKDPSLFSLNRRRKDGLQSECKSCRAIFLKKNYKQNKKRYMESAKQGRLKRAALLREIKHMKPCADCGKKYPYYVMDFDHRDPTQKDDCVAYIVRFSTPRMLKEIEKCDLVCSNCHRERTFGPIVKGTITETS